MYPFNPWPYFNLFGIFGFASQWSVHVCVWVRAWANCMIVIWCLRARWLRRKLWREIKRKLYGSTKRIVCVNLFPGKPDPCSSIVVRVCVISGTYAKSVKVLWDGLILSKRVFLGFAVKTCCRRALSWLVDLHRTKPSNTEFAIRKELSGETAIVAPIVKKQISYSVTHDPFIFLLIWYWTESSLITSGKR